MSNLSKILLKLPLGQLEATISSEVFHAVTKMTDAWKIITATSFVIQAVDDPQSLQNNLIRSKQNSDKAAQISHDPDPNLQHR